MSLKCSIIVNPLWNTTEVVEHPLLLKRIIRDGRFPVIEIWDTLNIEVLQLLEKFSMDIEFDVSLSPLMNNQKITFPFWGVSESANASFEYIKQRIAFLSHIGIKNISISSPQFYEGVDRVQQIESCILSLGQICDFANEYGMCVCFEAFDVFEHKKRVLGYTPELLQIFDVLSCSNLFLTWDLGHICLNHENPLDSLHTLIKHIKRVHISNYSLNSNTWFFGDMHLPFDFEGNIKSEDIVNVIDYLKSNSNNLSIAFEVAACNQIHFLKTFTDSYEYISSLSLKYTC